MYAHVQGLNFTMELALNRADLLKFGPLLLQ